VGRAKAQPSERLTSAHATWALASAEPLGLLTDPGVLDKAAAYLGQAYARADAADTQTRAALLHALATRRKPTFEQAHALNRLRQNLSDVSLAYLALTFAALERPSLAGEVLDVLGPRAKSESAGPGLPARRYWDGSSPHPWCRGPVEATGLAALAFAQGRPGDPLLRGATDWLLAHRVGTGWHPPQAKGPALAALAAFYGKGGAAEDRYRLVVSVNGEVVHQGDVVGSTEGRAIRVPRKAIKPGDANRVRFDIEGRGTFGYAVTLTGFTREFGPDQDPANRPFVISRRAYEPAEPEFEGRALPHGFGVAINASPFQNTVTQVPLGERARVRIDAHRIYRAGQPAWERD